LQLFIVLQLQFHGQSTLAAPAIPSAFHLWMADGRKAFGDVVERRGKKITTRKMVSFSILFILLQIVCLFLFTANVEHCSQACVFARQNRRK
jgi:hypothetical protein